MNDIVERLEQRALATRSLKRRHKDYDAETDEQARDEIVRLREALEWYASPAAWTMEQVEGGDGDYGNRARAALKGDTQ